MNSDEASVRACQLLREHFIPEDHPNKAVYDDKYIINNYTDEWSWFMQGWQEEKASQNIPLVERQPGCPYCGVDASNLYDWVNGLTKCSACGNSFHLKYIK